MDVHKRDISRARDFTRPDRATATHVGDVADFTHPVLVSLYSDNKNGTLMPKTNTNANIQALSSLALPGASHSSEITLAGSHRLHSTLAAAPVLFTHAAITVASSLYSLPAVACPDRCQ